MPYCVIKIDFNPAREISSEGRLPYEDIADLPADNIRRLLW